MLQVHEGTALEKSIPKIEAALREMGALPNNLLEWTVNAFDTIHNAMATRATKLRALVTISVCTSMLAACGFWEGRSLVPPEHGTPDFMTEMLIDDAAAKQFAQEQAGGGAHAAAAEVAPEQEVEDMYRVITIQDGDAGVLAAFERELGYVPERLDLPEGWVELFVLVIGQTQQLPDGTPRHNQAYDWDSLMSLNNVYGTDRIIHRTVELADLSIYMQQQEVSPENVHVSQ